MPTEHFLLRLCQKCLSGCAEGSVRHTARMAATVLKRCGTIRWAGRRGAGQRSRRMPVMKKKC